MKTIAFVTQKGGSGKSTLCVDLAVAAQEAGAGVCILEMDRQGTVSDWAEIRRLEPPEVAAVDSAQIDAVTTRLADFDFDYAFIDTPAGLGSETLAAIRSADICIVPARPTFADLHAIRATLSAIYRHEKRFAFVLNQTPPTSRRAEEAADSLVSLGVLPDVNIVLRTDHQDALGAGKGVTELNPSGKAAEEIRQLWHWVAERIGEPERRAPEAAPETSAELDIPAEVKAA